MKQTIYIATLNFFFTVPLHFIFINSIIIITIIIIIKIIIPLLVVAVTVEAIAVLAVVLIYQSYFPYQPVCLNFFYVSC